MRERIRIDAVEIASRQMRVGPRLHRTLCLAE
jgi:hypothetical protein